MFVLIMLYYNLILIASGIQIKVSLSSNIKSYIKIKFDKSMSHLFNKYNICALKIKHVRIK